MQPNTNIWDTKFKLEDAQVLQWAHNTNKKHAQHVKKQDIKMPKDNAVDTVTTKIWFSSEKKRCKQDFFFFF